MAKNVRGENLRPFPFVAKIRFLFHLTMTHASKDRISTIPLVVILNDTRLGRNPFQVPYCLKENYFDCSLPQGTRFSLGTFTGNPSLSRTFLMSYFLVNSDLQQKRRQRRRKRNFKIKFSFFFFNIFAILL